MSGPGAALYLHVPFCRARCAYCDFLSGTDASLHAQEYVEAVRIAVDHYAGLGLLDRVPSVYVGGGTPSVLGERLPAMLADVIGQIGLLPGAEVTVEANPESLTASLVDAVLSAGGNRFSLGVQSLDDAVLRILGRPHSAAQALAAAAILRESGVRFSVDLMCGVPGQSLESWRDSLERAVATGAEHLSIYPLTIEPGTPLSARVDSGEFPQTDPDTAATHMEQAEQILTAAGFERYEVASYARPDGRARHNVGYWTGVPYLGVGPGAASMLPQDGGRLRFVQHGTLDAFLADPTTLDYAECEFLTAQETQREDAMLGMRLTDGITDELAEAADAVAPLQTLVADGLVEHHDGRWRTTHRGWLLGNEVFERVWTGQ